MFLNMSVIKEELMNVSVCDLFLRVTGSPQALTQWIACKSNRVTSLSSNSLKVLLTPTGTSVINLRRRNAEACIQNHSVRRSRCYFQ